MPQPGKIGDDGGQGAQATLGTVIDISAKEHYFLNTANLKNDEPVIFDIKPFDIVIDGTTVKVKVAVLEKGADGKPFMGKKPWPPSFKKEWDSIWGNVDQTTIDKLKMKKNGKPLKKQDILNMDSSYLE